MLTGNAFINDMAQNASPFDAQTGNALLADTNTVIDPVGPPLAAGTYDNELLDIHYVAGDGRVNENVGLTAIQELFHSEHDRLLAQTQGHDPAEPRRRRHLLRQPTGCCRASI